MNDITAILKKLNPNPNDLFTVTVSTNTETSDKLTVIQTLESLAAHYNITIAILNEGTSIECIPEDQMNMLGWYRKV